MSGLLTAISTGTVAFGATNIDDLVILTLFFSQVNAKFRSHHIVLGQYAGFTALVLASLPGFFGGLIFPRPWIGLFGIVPIIMGIKSLLSSPTDDHEDEETTVDTSPPSMLGKMLGNWFNLQTYSVAAVTFANGTDNISIYVPIFASSSGQGLLVILGIFFALVGVLCYMAYRLTHQQAIAQIFTQYGNRFMPYVLIGLGTFIFLDSHSLSLIHLP
ncbi:cadmium resistance transporter [Anabaena sp. FACHB-1237]|uniref:cadmium resistance transporter n=1 Tax=Anabaena sp. FACHB-1237 TaxID=2692769 RepID=UPI0016804357|nr:cadmium resistance transporter [Anabaena sp. FACHB-1237]MBD2136547.1 cadmium resistance transporter [Anabaena sp. FACHB-1237]